MAVKPWQAGNDVLKLLEQVKEKTHSPRLEMASITLCFEDSRPFKKGKFNWGRVVKLNPLAKLFQQKDKQYDFLIMTSADAWHEVLSGTQREAFIDLHLTRIQPEFLPNFIEENGKKKPVKDKWGRVEYSNEVKCDEEGNPIWIINPLDMFVMADNYRRYGPWCEEHRYFRETIERTPQKDHDSDVVAVPRNDTLNSLFGTGWGRLVANADVEFRPNVEVTTVNEAEELLDAVAT
jgi:hypothetical protein